MPDRDRMEALREASERATQGPWRTGLWGNAKHVPGLEHIFMDEAEVSIQDVVVEDARFIVASVNFVRDLLSGTWPDQEAVERVARAILETPVEGEITGEGVTLRQVLEKCAEAMGMPWNEEALTKQMDCLARAAITAALGLTASPKEQAHEE